MRLAKIILPLAAVIVLAACTPAVVEPTPIPAPTGVIADFFPFHENTLITFDHSGGLGDLTSTYYTIFTEGNRMQRLVRLGDFSVVEVLEIVGGELRVNHARLQASGFENLIDVVDETPMVILREPIEVGNSWETHTGPTIQGVATGVSTITNVDVEIETPTGTVLAIEVSTEFENGFVEINYFARGIGLVQNGHFLPGFEIIRETSRMFREDMNVDMDLATVQVGAPLTVDFMVYYPNDNADDLDFSESSFTFETNGDIIPYLEAALRNPGGRGHGIISENTTINSLYITWHPHEDAPAIEAAKVHLDLSGDFSNDMNVGISYEQLILLAIEVTFLDFFNAQWFELTVDGEPHVSIH